jgi:hypothetical protein
MPEGIYTPYLQILCREWCLKGKNSVLMMETSLVPLADHWPMAFLRSGLGYFHVLTTLLQPLLFSNTTSESAVL